MKKSLQVLLVLTALTLMVLFWGCAKKNNAPALTGISTNSISMIFNGIPSGSFLMGSDKGDSSEKPVHKVAINNFFMSKYETTYANWAKVYTWAMANGYAFDNTGSMGYNYKGVSNDNPVVNVNWYDAVKWCNALSEMEKKTPVYYTDDKLTKVYKTGAADLNLKNVKWDANGYRLPTEAEWEYACRSASTNTYFWGDNANEMRNYTWYKENSTSSTHDVGTKQPNDWNLYDINGNVWEWCWDVFGSYIENENTDPKGPASGTNRVIKGGGWNSLAEDFRPSTRVQYEPTFYYNNMGFRIAVPAAK